MRLLVIGGKLQGTEAAYLAGEAGYEVVLADRRVGVPAAGLANETHTFDITADVARTHELVRSCDAVLPACEDDDTLAWLADHVPAWELPLLFDLRSYALTSSKVRSNDLFARLDVPRPLPWPRCGFPVVVKPSVGSGSHGVRLVRSEPELALARAELASSGDEVVAEEYVPGPSLSLEVIGWGAEAVALQATGLEFDALYDCKRVTAPVEPLGEVTAGVLSDLAVVSVQLARGLGLQGVMDVEVMVGGGQAKVLEIDARLPSQTPAAVFHSSGLNVVSMLYETVAHGVLPQVPPRLSRGAVYQHVLVDGGRVEVLGERVIGAAAPLSRYDGLWGADVVLTDRDRGRDSWVAIIMTRGDDLAAARAKADQAVARLTEEHRLELIPEGEPASVTTRGVAS
jgi:pyrrolysine biosynthesis protein PylC